MRKHGAVLGALGLVVVGSALSGCAAPVMCSGADQSLPSVELDVTQWSAAHPHAQVQARLGNGKKATIQEVAKVSAAVRVGKQMRFDLDVIVHDAGVTRSSSRVVDIPMTTQKTACGPVRHQLIDARLTKDGSIQVLPDAETSRPAR